MFEDMASSIYGTLETEMIETVIWPRTSVYPVWKPRIGMNLEIDNLLSILNFQT